MKPRTLPLLITTFALSAPLLHAADISFNIPASTTTEVTTAANWVGGIAPGPADIARWMTDADPVLAGNQEARGGILTIASPVSFLGLRHEDSVGPLTLTGAGITLGASGITEVRFELLTIRNNITLGAAQTWTNTAATTVSGNVSGAFGLTKSGSGILTLSGANTYSGPTTISQGTLTVPSLGSVGVASSSLGAPATAVDGTILFNTNAGTLNYIGTGETSDRVIRFGSANGGIVNQNGAGPLNLTSNMTGVASAMGVTVGGGGIGSMNGITNTTALLNFNKAGIGTWTVNGNLTLNGGNIRPQGGILAFSPTASTTGDAIISGRSNGGVLEFAPGSTIRTATANTNGILGGWATFNDNTWATTNGTGNAITGLANSSYTPDVFAAGNNTDVTLAGANPAAASTTHSLRFNEAGAKTLTLSGNNTLTSGGIMETAAVGANATTITGGTLLPANSGSSAGDFVVHQYNPAGALTIGSVLASIPAPAGQSATTTSGSTAVTGLTSTANLTVGMPISGTGIPANATIASITNSTAITISANATAAGTPSLTFGSSPNGFTKTGEGAVILNGANTYTGITRVHQGTLQVNANNGAKRYEVGPNADLDLGYSTGTFASGFGVTVAGTGTASTSGLAILGGTNQYFSNSLRLTAGPSTVRQYGTGAATINGFDRNATHLVVDDSASGSIIDPNITFVGGRYGYVMNVVAGANTQTGDLTIQGPLTGVPGTADLSDLPIYRKNGDGTLRLTGASTTSLPVEVRGGSLILSGGDNRLGTASSVVLGTGATGARLVLEGTAQTLVNLSTSGVGLDMAVVNSGAAPSTLTVNYNGTIASGPPTAIVPANPTATQVFSGRIGGTGPDENNLAFAKTGTGTYSLTGPNSYTGSTTISGGILSLGAANVLPDVSSVVLNGGTLLTGGFTESAGTLSLTANSTISLGGTSVMTFSGLMDSGFNSNTLSVWNWGGSLSGGGAERLLVPDGSLSAAQLANISFFSGNGTGPLGTAMFAPGGTGELIPVPEPSTLMAVLAFVGAALGRRRR